VIRNSRKEIKGEMIKRIMTRKKQQMITEIMLGMIEEITEEMIRSHYSCAGQSALASCYCSH